jgi:D-arabinose 1-dehydrogenase-like Zn-dependent alcohol dehydrogenase
MATDEEFSEMISHVQQTKMVPYIEAVFDLENAAEAFKTLANSSQFGKIVIRMNLPS